MRTHAGKITGPVAVAVGEAPDVHLIDDRVAPPWPLGPVAFARSVQRLRLGEGVGRGDRLDLRHVGDNGTTDN